MSHKLKRSFLALPASHYLRDFLSPTLSSVSILLEWTVLSQDMESGMSLSRIQQKERRRNLGGEMLWSVILALDQVLNRQHETWIFSSHVATFMALFGTFPSYFVTGSDFVYVGSAEICLRSAVGEMWWKSQQLTVCQESLVCGVQASGTGSSDCMGLWFPCHFCLLEKPLRSSSSCWDTGLVTRRLRAVWRRLGLCWFSLIGQGPTLSSLRQVMGLKTPVWKERWCFPKESGAPVIISNIRDSLCRVSPPGILLVVRSVKWAAEIQPIPLLSLASVSSCIPGELVVGAPISSENHSYVFRASAEHALLQGLLLML